MISLQCAFWILSFQHLKKEKTIFSRAVLGFPAKTLQCAFWILSFQHLKKEKTVFSRAVLGFPAKIEQKTLQQFFNKTMF
jgi:hypothetical protein